jgi:hypothetical protein
MNFKPIVVDQKLKRQMYICWALSPFPLVLAYLMDLAWLPAIGISYWLLFGPFIFRVKTQYSDHFEKPLNQLRLEGKMLHVKQHQVEIAKVHKVAIDRINADTAFIDFPYTMYGKLQFSFPAKELPAVKQFFQQNCAEIQIIS